jgi:hypothetical protein
MRSIVLVLAVAACAVSLSAQGPSAADQKELENYRLVLETVRKAAQANTAMAKMIEADPGLAEHLNQDEDDNPSVSAMIKRLEAEPAIRGALKGAGLTARDYALTTLALFQAVMVVEMKQAGMGGIPLPGATGENVAFVEKNAAAVKEFRDSTERLAIERSRRDSVVRDRSPLVPSPSKHERTARPSTGLS